MTLPSAALETVWRDLRYAVGSFRRAPGVTFVAILTLALAIGATTAIFSLLNALVLRELPVRDPQTLVNVAATTRLTGESRFTFPLFRELSRRQQVFSAVIGTWGNSLVTVSDRSTTMKGLLWAATTNVHDELGVRPVTGRLLVASDMTMDPPGASAVSVLGHGFWRRHYGDDASVVGRTIRVDGVPFTVVGVAPPGFTGFALTTEPDITIPLAALQLLGRKTPLATSDVRNIEMVGRLKEGSSLEQARTQLAAVWPDALEAAMPATFDAARRADFRSMGLQATSAATGNQAAPLRLRYTRPLTILLGIACLVLAIACANVASVQLSRASARRHEIGMRLALGASRLQVAQQLVTEGLLLSLAGAAAGLLLAYWACATIVRVVFADLRVPTAFDGSPDLLVIAVTIAVAIGAGVVCSVIPAWRSTRSTTGDALRAEGRTFSGDGRTGRLIVGTQLALSLVLLTVAGVLVRSLAEVRALDTGIARSDEVLVVYSEAAQPDAYLKVDNDAYYPQVLSRLEALPGVQRASVSLLKPGTGGGFREAIARLDNGAAAGIPATHSPVAPGFFEAVGVRLLRGRDFDWRDNSRGQRVAILSESLARRLFGEADPIGQSVRVGLEPSRDRVEIVGIVADARLYDLKNPDVLAAYTPALQDRNASFKCFVVRGDGVTLAALTTTIEELGRERISSSETLQYITDRALLLERLTAAMSGFFGSLVVLLAGVGLFGVMSQAVTQRRKEIGIRMAVGASHRRVAWGVIRDGLAVTLIGVAVGLVAALSTVRVVEALLFGVEPEDPLTLAMAAASLIVTAMVACTVPALRASRVDPLFALRGD